jgi:membrane-bound lytic murein transglycosylase A
MSSRVWRAAAVLGAALVFGCAAPGEHRPETTAGGAEHRLALTPVKYSDLPGWAEDHASEALAALLDQCRVLGSLPAEQKLGGQGEAQALGGTPVQWRAACEAARGVPAGDDAAARGFFERQFQPYAVSDNGQSAPSARAEGLFTGYFDPEVAGSRSPGPGYRVALYSRPNDLVQVDLGQFADDLQGRSVSGRVQGGKLVPYFDRAEIEAGALASRRLELIWLADPVDAYFLQVQGSGRVKLPDGHVARVTYNGQNGRRSVLLGKILADRGEIPLDQVSLESIRAWLNSHPDQAEAVLNENPSYVFFREDNSLRPDQGPPGALGVPLTPWRSIAVDRAFIPLGAPVFVATTDPLTGEKLRRLMLAQDVGGAIRGPVRADIFFGWGPDAEARAGRMRQPGTDYVLLPRPAVTASVAR